MESKLLWMIICLAFLKFAELEPNLSPNKDEIKLQETKDQARYMRTIKEGQEDGSTRFEYSSTPKLGFYVFHLYFPFPPKDQILFSVTLSSMMKTLNKDLMGKLNTDITTNHYVWIPINFVREESESEYDFVYKISVEEVETKWIRKEMNQSLEFSSEFKIIFNYTEKNGNLMDLTLNYPAKIIRIKSFSGIFVSSRRLPLIFDVNSKEINLSFSAILLPCVDKFPADTTLCTKISSEETPPSYQLNELAKFILFLNNSEFASNYYLFKKKIELKTNEMKNYVDFTDAVSVGPPSKGQMIFILPMSIVGSEISVTASVEISPFSLSDSGMNNNIHKESNLSVNDNIWFGMYSQNIF